MNIDPNAITHVILWIVYIALALYIVCYIIKFIVWIIFTIHDFKEGKRRR